ncbi:MAG: ATP-binding cassette domain-containing protein [Cyclobacteriaceae bacterium]
MSLLEVQHINTGYGKKQVLFDVSVSIKEGDFAVVVGSNGSGKSTLFKAIVNDLPLCRNKEYTSDICFEGNSIIHTETHDLLKKGLLYVPQKNELFEDMTVQENLIMSILHEPESSLKGEKLNTVFEEIPILITKRNQIVHELSGGERKLLSLGMVLMNKPKLLLYDEPLAGLSRGNITTVINLLLELHKKGTTIVLIEHRIKALLPIVTQFIGFRLGKRNTRALNTLENIKTFLV